MRVAPGLRRQSAVLVLGFPAVAILDRENADLVPHACPSVTDPASDEVALPERHNYRSLAEERAQIG